MTDYIDFKTMKGFTLEMVLAEIDRVITIAGKYGGGVFGGYVRDVIVPRLYKPGCDVQFKDVDFWFTDKSNQDRFLAEMGDQLRIVTFPLRMEGLYEFERQQYNLFSHGTCVAWIDVITAPKLPVNDFDVNCLVYRKVNGKEYYDHCFSDPRANLTQRIMAKEVRIMPDYAKMLANRDLSDLTKRGMHLNRVQLRYIKRGWKVFYGDNLFQEGELSFYQWIYDQVHPKPTATIPNVTTPTPSATSANSTPMTAAPVSETITSRLQPFSVASFYAPYFAETNSAPVAKTTGLLPFSAARFYTQFFPEMFGLDRSSPISPPFGDPFADRIYAKYFPETVPTASPTSSSSVSESVTINRKDLLAALESLEAAHRAIVKLLEL